MKEKVLEAIRVMATVGLILVIGYVVIASAFDLAFHNVHGWPGILWYHQ